MLTSGVILCLQCQSSHVDVLYWTRLGAVTQCANCGCKGFISCLSIGRVNLQPEQIIKAQRDMALPTSGKVG